MLRLLSLVCASCLMLIAVSLAEADEPKLHAAKPSPEQVEWHSRNSMFICLDPCTWQGNEIDDHTTPLSAINPTKLNTDQWCEVAKSWGAEQILFVAKPVAENKGGQAETIVLELPKATPINHVILAEDILEGGQRIREYIIEGRKGNDWVVLVPNGSSVGFNRIDQFETQEVSAIRLRVTKSVGMPLVTRLAAFHVTDR